MRGLVEKKRGIDGVAETEQNRAESRPDQSRNREGAEQEQKWKPAAFANWGSATTGINNSEAKYLDTVRN